MIKWRIAISNYLKELAEKNEPLRTELIVPASAQEEFEGHFTYTCHCPCVTACSVEHCCYMISVEHAGLLDHYRNRPASVIQAVNLAVRRFYQRHGLTVSAADIYVFPAAYGFVIWIALNGYGRKRILTCNREQRRNLKQ